MSASPEDVMKTGILTQNRVSSLSDTDTLENVKVKSEPQSDNQISLSTNNFEDVKVKIQPRSDNQSPPVGEDVEMKSELLSSNQSPSYFHPFTDTVKTEMSLETDCNCPSSEVSIKTETDPKVEIHPQSPSQYPDVDVKPVDVDDDDEMKDGHFFTPSSLPNLSLSDEINQDRAVISSSGSGLEVKVNVEGSGPDNIKDHGLKMCLQERSCKQIGVDVNESQDSCVEWKVFDNKIKNESQAATVTKIISNVNNCSDKVYHSTTREGIKMDQRKNIHKQFISVPDNDIKVHAGHNAKQFTSCDNLPVEPTRNLTIQKLDGIIDSEVKSYTHQICEPKFTGDQQHNCPVEKATPHKLDLQRPIVTEEKVHYCPTCGKPFLRGCDLRKHLRTHTGEKPHECPTCGKTFSCRSNLCKHMRDHTGEKPHECSTCGKTFSRKFNLRMHIKTHTGEKPHKCTICENTFSALSSLQTHVRVHTGEKPHECPTCGKSYTALSTLHKHIRTHTGEKPHECLSCGKAFSTRSVLHRHIRIHT